MLQRRVSSQADTGKQRQGVSERKTGVQHERHVHSSRDSGDTLDVPETERSAACRTATDQHGGATLGGDGSAGYGQRERAWNLVETLGARSWPARAAGRPREIPAQAQVRHPWTDSPLPCRETTAAYSQLSRRSLKIGLCQCSQTVVEEHFPSRHSLLPRLDPDVCHGYIDEEPFLSSRRGL